ncbi:hypothetical protein M885DRAFT_212306 [Pelagophyceae sp. CCMP2097]|nr:hypothetical protein M885DRAFT_212306 [Pelagophyceae sp. CCMP2097]
MLDELDFKKEAENLIAFRKWLDDSGLNSVATAPVPYPAASRGRVLTMERLRGVALTDLKTLKREYGADFDAEQTLVNALNTWTMSVVECEFFHADVHAGNLLVRSFGMRTWYIRRMRRSDDFGGGPGSGPFDGSGPYDGPGDDPPLTVPEAGPLDGAKKKPFDGPGRFRRRFPGAIRRRSSERRSSGDGSRDGFGDGPSDGFGDGPGDKPLRPSAVRRRNKRRSLSTVLRDVPFRRSQRRHLRRSFRRSRDGFRIVSESGFRDDFSPVRRGSVECPGDESRQWVPSMGPGDESRQWVPEMSPVNGSRQWVSEMGPVNGSRR